MRLAVIGAGYVGPRLRRLFRRLRPYGRLRRQGRGQDRGAEARRDPDLRARARRTRRQQRPRGPARPSPPTSPRACEGAEAVFIAVGTPSRRGDGHADLSYVYAAAREIAAAARRLLVVVTKSTVPVGTGDEVERIIREVNGRDADFDVVSNPEFLREGAAIDDFKRPDRIVVGADDAARARR